MLFVHFPSDTFSSVSKFLFFSFSLPLCATPSPHHYHLTVKVILIKSSRRTELLIAPRRSSWFQIQIKARCLFPSSSPVCPPFPHLSASPLFHHVKYNLSISHVDCHSLTSASITSQDREKRWRGKQGFFVLMITGWFPTGTHERAHACKLYLFRNVQPVILGSDKWGVHEVRSFYKYLCVWCMCVCVSIFVSDFSISKRQQSAGW